ncbi:hypothetical protein V565_186870 [Rhizoctonia solani 123E]|uniref:HeH/LEM domain protein n=1 Tax=Rhizoctonia solani 123E TaxID=1423351 RepID=A0A074S9G4_9AGAM|nr:hypothetical protein V565_186870 [Rhizoctonia solani 123E]
MEAELKALKVADLKKILTKSSTPIPSKANKSDLITKVLATSDALKLAGGDPAAASVEAPAEAPAKPVDDDLVREAARPAERDASTQAEDESKQVEVGATKPVDEELERRKAHATSFGVLWSRIQRVSRMRVRVAATRGTVGRIQSYFVSAREKRGCEEIKSDGRKE